MNRDWDIDWDYWDAQTKGYKDRLRKPLWRDYLETQRELMDRVHDFFWEKSLNGGESTRRREESNEEPEHAVGKKLSPPIPPVNTSDE